jgi:predicted SprT family Zn-dependent metalloprotease
MTELHEKTPPRLRANRQKLPSARALERYCRFQARRFGAFGLAVRVVYQPRLRTTLGRAEGETHTIELNPHLLARHPEELLETLLHELCHLLAGVSHGHGPRWCAWMERFGLEPKSCHSLGVASLRVSRRRWLWRCRGCGVEFDRGSRAARRYRCARCGGRLQVVGSDS